MYLATLCLLFAEHNPLRFKVIIDKEDSLLCATLFSVCRAVLLRILVSPVTAFPAQLSLSVFHVVMLGLLFQDV